ncbi:hypothetical protein ACHAWU_002775 [Discostella pseudostelligera]|uniref:Uncharacterized protein n=1 Tax=Discostella pseudostelligera TaxID=259834 RepID=A0ABD3MPX8_9STRA
MRQQQQFHHQQQHHHRGLLAFVSIPNSSCHCPSTTTSSITETKSSPWKTMMMPASTTSTQYSNRLMHGMGKRRRRDSSRIVPDIATSMVTTSISTTAKTMMTSNNVDNISSIRKRGRDGALALLFAAAASSEEGAVSAEGEDGAISGGKPDIMGGGVDISIEYCSACRWMLRASWIAMELLTTFVKEDRLAAVTLIPTGGGGMQEEEGGIFRVSANDAVLWDRKVMGRFPESKEVKQLVRDIVDPTKDLGHSDVGAEKNIVVGEGDCIECKESEADEKNEEGKVQEDTEQSPPLRQQQQQSILAAPSSLPPLPSIISNNQRQYRISIEYSTGGGSIDSPDNGLYRAAYYANELLSMVYERNAWWKKRRQSQLELDDDADNSDDNNDAIPIAVDSVSFIPVRLDGDLSVSIALEAKQSNFHPTLFFNVLTVALFALYEKRVKLNDQILLEQSSSQDDKVPTTTNIGDMADGRHLRTLVRNAIQSLSRSSSDADDDTGDNNNSNDGIVAIDMMDDDAAEQARKYFGVF